MQAQIFEGIQQVEQTLWNTLTQGYPYAGWEWYRYGERVLGSAGYYVILYSDSKPIGAASFLVQTQDVLPAYHPILRWIIQKYLEWRPLLVCRTPPLTNYSGLFLPTDPLLQAEALREIQQVGLRIAKEKRASFLLFDYLPETLFELEWNNFIKLEDIFDPGTQLEIKWETFNDYLRDRKQNSKNFWKNYRYQTGRAREIGLTFTIEEKIKNREEAISLIQNNSDKYGQLIPYLSEVIDRIHLIPCSRWLHIVKDDKLVGCELLLVDIENQVCKPILYGRDYRTEYLYTYLYYKEIEFVIETLHAKHLSGGSGNYQFKGQLGFTVDSQSGVILAIPSGWQHKLLNYLLNLIF